MEDCSSAPIYRVFPLSRAGTVNMPAMLIEAANDEDAVRRAQSLVSTQPLELWDRARFIAKIEPVPVATRP